MTKYSSSNIRVGDKVYFNSPDINNHDLYWTVTEILDNMLKIQINEMGINESTFISFSEITRKLEN